MQTACACWRATGAACVKRLRRVSLAPTEGRPAPDPASRFGQRAVLPLGAGSGDTLALTVWEAGVGGWLDLKAKRKDLLCRDLIQVWCRNIHDEENESCAHTEIEL